LFYCPTGEMMAVTNALQKLQLGKFDFHSPENLNKQNCLEAQYKIELI
jgi:hypothetical protein